MSGRFNIKTTPLADLFLIERLPIGDKRGYLERMLCIEDLKPCLKDRSIVQVNHTLTEKAGTVRGLHFQHSPHAETKIVSCIRGEVFDVAVDLRRNSETFLKWFSVVLSEKNHLSLVIPEGFAHGFQTITDGCEMLYFHTHVYTPSAEAALNALDPLLNIAWPLKITERSARDKDHKYISSEFLGETL